MSKVSINFIKKSAPEKGPNGHEFLGSNLAPSEIATKIIKSIQKSLGLNMTIWPSENKLDSDLYKLGPKCGYDIKAKEVSEPETIYEGPNGRRRFRFEMTVSIKTRYKSFGSDREFRVPVYLEIFPLPDEEDNEWGYDFSIEKNAFKIERNENSIEQHAIIEASRNNANKLTRSGLKHMYQGGAPGTGKKA